MPNGSQNVIHDAIPLRQAALCVACEHVVWSNASTCPKCASEGSLLSLARVLNPSPELGKITYILRGEHESND